MLSTQSTITTSHDDMIHDAQMDYYGRRLATCSSDCHVKIFDVLEGKQRIIKDLTGHTGPVWEVAWAHPQFGSILASCSYDKKVIIWKETATGWENVFEHTQHQGSVNSISWAPFQCGVLALACGSSDGNISILMFRDGVWESFKKDGAHQTGVNAVSWQPFSDVEGLQKIRLCSGGCDKKIAVFDVDLQQKIIESCIKQPQPDHQDWVRDVAWAPAVGFSGTLIASCSQAGEVNIWSQASETDDWRKIELHQIAGVAVWRLSWSVTGNVLAVSRSDNTVVLYKQNLTGDWREVASNPLSN